ncbi:hypothetical protein V6N13_068774 [Hibiscus sabdariffa]
MKFNDRGVAKDKGVGRGGVSRTENEGEVFVDANLLSVVIKEVYFFYVFRERILMALTIALDGMNRASSSRTGGHPF